MVRLIQICAVALIIHAFYSCSLAGRVREAKDESPMYYLSSWGKRASGLLFPCTSHAAYEEEPEIFASCGRGYRCFVNSLGPIFKASCFRISMARRRRALVP